ncbi:MAG TPA: hypothetical protein VGA99_13365 [bacterium]
MKKSQKVQFGVCITNSEPDLELRKIYQFLPDDSAEKSNYVRVIDESGEDYLYPSDYFVPIDLPDEVEKVFLQTVE